MAGEGKYLHGVNHLYRSLAQLTSIVTAFQSLDKRDDDSLCPSTKYVSPNGQIFQTHCDHKLSSDADDYYYYTDTESRSFEDCMGECGTSRTLCYAVAYHTVNGHCLFFDNSTSLLGNGGGGDGKSYNVAIADVDQLDKPSGCPFKNGATYTTPNGLEFEIVCNVDYGMDAGDYCVDGYADWTCYAHADTMEDCLNFCADAHPLCQGVTYDPAMYSGFGNCYLKRDPFAVPNPDKSLNGQSAKVKLPTLYNVDTSCESDDSYTTDHSSSKYSVSCYESRIGSQNITATHATSLDACLNDCSGVDGCKGVVYDMSLGYGYENCYIQNKTGQANHGANATFALRLSDPSNDSSNNKSNAWIAGPVIGVIAAILLLVAFGLWWRKRKARRNIAPYENVSKEPIYEKDQPKIYEVGPGAHGPYERRYELRDVNSEALFQHEIGRSP